MTTSRNDVVGQSGISVVCIFDVKEMMTTTSDRTVQHEVEQFSTACSSVPHEAAEPFLRDSPQVWMLRLQRTKAYETAV